MAKREGVRVERVRCEIDRAIGAARKNDDPEIQAFWDSIPTKDNGPLTAEDVIAFFVQMDMNKTE